MKIFEVLRKECTFYLFTLLLAQLAAAAKVLGLKVSFTEFRFTVKDGNMRCKG